VKTVVVLVVLGARAAMAQVAPSANLEQLWVDPAGLGSSFVGNGRTLPAQHYRVGLTLVGAHNALRMLEGRTALSDRIGFQVFAALGLFQGLEISANAPVVAWQDSTSAVKAASGGLGNPWVHAKFNLVTTVSGTSVAVDLGVGFPLGTAAALGNGGLEFAPKVQVGKVFSLWQWGAEVGYLSRSTADVGAQVGSPLVLGSQLWVAAMVTAVNTTGPRGEASIRAMVPMTGTPVGAEVQLGVRVPLGPAEFFAVAGPGLGGAPGTPTVRAWLGVSFANAPVLRH
jgi:OOP family OmpA-OmpF porin